MSLRALVSSDLGEYVQKKKSTRDSLNMALSGRPETLKKETFFNFFVIALQTSLIQRQTKDVETPNELAICSVIPSGTHVIEGYCCPLPRRNGFTHWSVLSNNFVLNLSSNVVER